MISIARSAYEPQEPVTIDRLATGAVYGLLGGLQTSSRLFMADQTANEKWVRAMEVVVDLQTRLGEELPGAVEALRLIRADPWAGITAEWGDTIEELRVRFG